MGEKIVSKKNQLYSILFMLILMGITVIAIIKEYSIEHLIKVVSSVHPFYIISGILLMFFYAGCQGMNFYLVMDRLGHTVSYKNCIEYAYIGNYFNAITPGASGGQPAQIYYMSKDKIRIDLSAITIFLLIFVSQIVIIFMGGLCTLLRYQVLEQVPHWFLWLLLAGTGVMLALTAILVALMFSKVTMPFLMKLTLKLGKKLHVIKKTDEMQMKFDNLLLSYRVKAKIILKNPDLFVKVFIITVMQWIAYCMVAYLVYLSFGYRSYDFLDLMTGQSFINIAVSAVPLPGSVGVAEKAYLTVFGQFYSSQEVPSAMLLSRIINFYLPLLISYLVYIFAHHRIMKAQR